MLTLFRGDDLAFAENNRKVCIRFNTYLDLTGWSARFYLVDIVKSTDDISSRMWAFGYTAEETMTMPLGKTYGKLVVIDAEGRQRVMAKVKVDVVNWISEPCIDGDIAISIDTIFADYNLLMNRPSLNGKTIEGDHDSEYYGIDSTHGVEDLRQRVDTLEAQMNGDVPIEKLLFKVPGSEDRYYSVRVALRDNGAGTDVPTFALGEETIDDSSASDDSDSEVSD